MQTRILYISYDGLTDPLGQSQVVPYLLGLAQKKYRFAILSTEKKSAFKKNESKVIRQLSQGHIHWDHIKYTKRPAVLSTVIDVFRLRRKAVLLYKKYSFSIVHCRSYIAAFAGLYLKRKYGIRFIFDLRGFYPDERVDGAIWNKNRFPYNLVYKFLKKKEHIFIKNADYVISLTCEGKKIIQEWNKGKICPDIEVIPCCADPCLFSPINVNPELREQLMQRLSISCDDFVLCYLGSTGTWYMMDEMLSFFERLHIRKSNARFLVITRDRDEDIRRMFANFSFPPDRIVIVSAEREEIPGLLSLCNIAVLFIKPAFSKKASSPTKFAEVLFMGKPVVCNSGVGDIDYYLEKNNVGLLIREFSTEEYEKALDKIDIACNVSPDYIRSVAEEYFSLDRGVDLYDSVYRKLIENRTFTEN
ncbi:MAG: glycosyltransferase [Bacteroidetes bacterium]|nr:glycosyltransferase [Bacteroidota bacterium]